MIIQIKETVKNRKPSLNIVLEDMTLGKFIALKHIIIESKPQTILQHELKEQFLNAVIKQTFPLGVTINRKV